MSELEEKIRTYFKNKKEVVAIYLFGSYAAGKEGHLSDIDIGILLDRKELGLVKDIVTDSIVRYSSRNTEFSERRAFEANIFKGQMHPD